MAGLKPFPSNYDRCVAITTSDTVAISTGVADGILITAAGNIVFVDGAGNVTTVTGALVGTVINVRVMRVNLTGTTATASALYAY